MGFLSECLSVYHMNAWQQQVLEPLEPELQKVVRHPVSAVSKHSSSQWRENFLPWNFDSSQLWFAVRVTLASRLDIGSVERKKKQEKTRHLHSCTEHGTPCRNTALYLHLNLALEGQPYSFLPYVQISSALNLGWVMPEVGKRGQVLMYPSGKSHSVCYCFVFSV